MYFLNAESGESGGLNLYMYKSDLGENNVNIQKLEISSFQDFISEIATLNFNVEPKTLIYRGHKSTAFELIPGAGRKDVNLTLHEEKTIFHEFKRNYRRFYPLKLENDVDILMLAQHYGLKTRLLDWSYNPLIALYMAVQPTSKEEEDYFKKGLARHIENFHDGEIFIRKIKETKIEEGTKTSPFDFDENTLLVPETFEIRFINQEGLFEIFSEPSQESLKGIIKKIVIKKEAKNEILKIIKMLGTTKLFVYPTLENLCDEINNRYIKSE